MTRRRNRSMVFVALTALMCGCAAFQSMRDPTPGIDTSRTEYVRNNPGNRFNDDIGVGRIRKGMSRLQVRVTWGDPDQIVRGIGNETWAYQETEPSRGYAVCRLRFEGELLSRVDLDHSGVPLSTDESAPQNLDAADKALQSPAVKK